MIVTFLEACLKLDPVRDVLSFLSANSIFYVAIYLLLIEGYTKNSELSPETRLLRVLVLKMDKFVALRELQRRKVINYSIISY